MNFVGACGSQRVAAGRSGSQRVAVGRSGSQRVTRSEIALDDLRYLRKGIVKRMMDVLGRYMGRGWFYCPLVSGVGGGSKGVLERVQL